MFITPAHYSDVVNERSIIELCGYPLCQKTQDHSRTQKAAKEKEGCSEQNVDSKAGEQTVSEVTEQLDNCRSDSQEKVATCKLPLKKESTQISSPGPLCDRFNTSAISEHKHGVSQVTLVGISKKSAEHFRSKFAKSRFWVSLWFGTGAS